MNQNTHLIATKELAKIFRIVDLHLWPFSDLKSIEKITKILKSRAGDLTLAIHITTYSAFKVVLRLSGCLLEILLGSLENLTARQNSNSKLLEKILLEKGSNSILLEKIFARTRSLEICLARFARFLLDNQNNIYDMNKYSTLLFLFLFLYSSWIHFVNISRFFLNF